MSISVFIATGAIATIVIEQRNVAPYKEEIQRLKTQIVQNEKMLQKLREEETTREKAEKAKNNSFFCKYVVHCD